MIHQESRSAEKEVNQPEGDITKEKLQKSFYFGDGDRHSIHRVNILVWFLKLMAATLSVLVGQMPNIEATLCILPKFLEHFSAQ
jgi:hypothetical protein